MSYVIVVWGDQRDGDVLVGPFNDEGVASRTADQILEGYSPHVGASVEWVYSPAHKPELTEALHELLVEEEV